jgi:hypothetical protein|tara:strand:- start:176 stop:415 length:240 start_codon:yes stop_codon:yes gene_type:complete
MAFDSLDTSTPRTDDLETSVEEVLFRRNREIGGEELEVIVTKMEDGHRSSHRVAQATVDSTYNGSAKKLKTHLNELADL